MIKNLSSFSPVRQQQIEKMQLLRFGRFENCAFGTDCHGIACGFFGISLTQRKPKFQMDVFDCDCSRFCECCFFDLDNYSFRQITMIANSFTGALKRVVTKELSRCTNSLFKKAGEVGVRVGLYFFFSVTAKLVVQWRTTSPIPHSKWRTNSPCRAKGSVSH